MANDVHVKTKYPAELKITLCLAKMTDWFLTEIVPKCGSFFYYPQKLSFILYHFMY